MQDGSERHKLIGGPYHGITVRTYGTDPLPFPAGGGRPAALYVWGQAVTGKGKNAKTIETYVHSPSEGTIS